MKRVGVLKKVRLVRVRFLCSYLSYKSKSAVSRIYTIHIKGIQLSLQLVIMLVIMPTLLWMIKNLREKGAKSDFYFIQNI